MKLWKLMQTKKEDTYDEMCGFVIRAETAQEARQIAAQNAGDEGPQTWQSGLTSSCREVKLEGRPGVILEDFHHA